MLTVDQLKQVFADGLGDEQVGGAVFPCRTKSDPERALMGLLAQTILELQGLAPASGAVTATVTDAVTAATVAAGASSITFVNVGSASGTVAGVTLAPGQPPITLVAPANKTLPAIDYTASATAIIRITRTGA